MKLYANYTTWFLYLFSFAIFACGLYFTFVNWFGIPAQKVWMLMAVSLGYTAILMKNIIEILTEGNLKQNLSDIFVSSLAFTLFLAGIAMLGRLMSAF